MSMSSISSLYSIAPPRQIGVCNWIGITALIQKEVGRFLNVYMQTIVAPVMTLMLFFVVFHLSSGAQSGNVNVGYTHMMFLGPGLLMMSMVQNAFANPSSSLIIAKVQGNIVDILMPPLSPWELLTGMMVGAVLRAVLIGILGFAMLNFMVPLHIVAPLTVFSFMILGNIMLASLGVMAGLWAEKFDHMATVTNFIVTPLTFLSGTFYALSALPPF
ncbi:MAG: ABC transporter permease, partial [Pseudomonadota bacterium]